MHHCIGVIMKMCHFLPAILPFMVVATAIVKSIVVNKTELMSKFVRQ